MGLPADPAADVERVARRTTTRARPAQTAVRLSGWYIAKAKSVARANFCSVETAELLVTVQRPARSGRSQRCAMRRAGNASQSAWQVTTRWLEFEEVADAEMSNVRNSLGTVVITEFGSGFLAAVHPGNSSATRVMRCPLSDVVDFSRDDDPAVVSGVVQGDLFARDGACTLGGSSWHPELAGDRGVVGLGGSAEVPRS